MSDPLPKYTVDENNIRYIKKDIGKGAYGSVSLICMNETICIEKSLHTSLLGIHDKEDGAEESIQWKKFRQECDLLCQMHHPNIVQFIGVRYKVDRHNSKQILSLIMEYLPSSIEECITECKDEGYKIPLSIILSILKDVSCGLIHLHLNKIIHRDLSASNVLLTSGLQAKIADLGVSKLLNPLELVTRTQVPGTPYILPPEAYELNPSYTFQYDIYSFGVLSVYFLTQKLPYPPEFANIIQSLTQYCSLSMKTIVESCVRRRPIDRPSSVKLSTELAHHIHKHKFNFCRDKISFLSNTRIGMKMMVSLLAVPISAISIMCICCLFVLIILLYSCCCFYIADVITILRM